MDVWCIGDTRNVSLGLVQTPEVIYYKLQSSLQMQRSVLLDDTPDVTCTLFDTWLHMLRGVLSKLLPFRILIIHSYRI